MFTSPERSLGDKAIGMQREEVTCSSAAALCHTKVKRRQKMKKIKMQPVTKTTLTTILSTLALVVAIGFAREAGAKSPAESGHDVDLCDRLEQSARSQVCAQWLHPS